MYHKFSEFFSIARDNSRQIFHTGSNFVFLDYSKSCIYMTQAWRDYLQIGHNTDLATALTMRTVSPAKPIILCIEDEPSYLSLRRAVLERAGYIVIGVITAGDALKALRETPINATIADNMLEGTTGAELAKEMKKIKPDVPIILLSGSPPQDLSSVDVYVRKGDPTEKLLSIVRDVVQRSCS